MFSNERGITPLVATVLLVAFSVGLGALVMSWGEDYIAEKAEFAQGTSEVKSDCDNTKIDIITINKEPQVCLSPAGLQVWIDNGPNVDLVNIHARLAGTNSIDVKENTLLSPLLKANAARILIPVNKELGSLLQVKLTPKVFSGTKTILCAEQAITVEKIQVCYNG